MFIQEVFRETPAALLRLSVTKFNSEDRRRIWMIHPHYSACSAFVLTIDKPGLTTFRIALANGMCKLAGQLVRFVIKDQSWTTF